MILKPTPQERAMKAHDVMLRAMAGRVELDPGGGSHGDLSPVDAAVAGADGARGHGRPDGSTLPALAASGTGPRGVVASSAVQGSLSGVQRAPLPRGPRP